MRTQFRIVLIATTVSGCQTGADALTASRTPPELSSAASSAIAGDMVSRFAEQVGPGTGTIVLKEGTSRSVQVLAAALKGWGYAVVTDQKTDEKTSSIQLSYVVDDFEGQSLARLSTSKLELARAYSTTTAGAAPASPLSVRRN